MTGLARDITFALLLNPNIYVVKGEPDQIAASAVKLYNEVLTLINTKPKDKKIDIYSR